MKTKSFNRLLMLTLALLTLCVTQVWGAAETLASFSNSSNTGWTISGSPSYSNSGGYQLVANTMTITSPSINFANYTNITINITCRKYGGPNATQGKISVKLGTTSGTELTTYSPSGTSLVSSSDLSISPTGNSKLVIYCPGASSSKGCGISSIVIKGEAADACTAPGTALSITSAATATVGTPLSLTSAGGNGGTVTWSVTNGTGSATVSGSTLNPATAGTVTVKAHQDQNGTTCEQDAEKVVTISKQIATITLSEAGNESNVGGTHYVGDSYDLPTTTEATCGDKVLVGWSTVQISIAGAKPISNYYEKGASVTLGATNRFYAVFATASAGGAETWVEITSAPDAGTYAILCESYFMKAEVTSNRFQNGSATPSITDGKLNSAPAEDCQWEISKPDSYYRIKNGTNYAGATGSKNQGALITDASDDKAKWSISYVTDHYEIINYARSISSTDPNNKYLRNNTTNGWATYISTTGSAPRLFKKTGGSTYTDYITECSEPTQCATPTFTPAAGTHTGAQNVTISCSTPGATIHYTTDGTTPTSSSPTYSSTISVNQDKTLKAIAIKVGLTDSEVATAAYVINYTVTFNMKGHGSAPATLTTVKYNTSINGSKPADPSVAGYTFGGWYKDDACTNAWNWSTDKVTSNITLYAKWTPITYTITYNNLNGASNSNPTSYTKETETINFAAPGARDGYRFDGWYDNSGFTGSAVTTLTKGSTTGDKQYWAKWTEQYTITWNNYGEESVKTYVWAGEAIGSTMPADPSGDCLNGGKHYDDFKCWYKEEITDPALSLTDSKKVTSATIPTGDVTYYAVYTDLTDPGNVFTRITSPSAIVDGMDVVIAHSSGALQLNSGLKAATLPAESNNQITVTDTKMIWTVGTSGSYFTLTNGTSKLGAASIPSNNSSTAVTASATPTKYQWSFAAHNTSNTLLIKMESSNAALEYYSSAWKIYNNSGVASNADCALKVYGRQFVDGKYLTTCCQQIAITYDNSIAHGRVSGSKAQACQGETVNLTATPENAAYRFDSWNVYKTDAPATKVTVTDNQFTMPAYPVTVSATFVEAAHYDVTWSVGGDETVVPFVENADLVLPTPPTCPNKSFMGWTTQENYSNLSSAPGDIFTSAGTKKVTGDITYYAVFATSNVAPDKNFTLDFTTGTNNFGNLANAEGTKTWSYELESGANITASVPDNIMYYNNTYSKYYSLRANDFSNLTGKNGYIRFPGIAGYKLTRVVATGAAQNSDDIDMAICNVSTSTATAGGTAKQGATSAMTWDLTGTSTGTAYDLYIVGRSSRSRNMELSKLQLRYVSTGGASYSNYTTECDTKFNINKVEDGGTVTVADSKTKADAGETVTFTAAAASGYTFGGTTSDVRVYKNYGEDPADIISVTLNAGTFSFTMPDADVTIEPNFVCTNFTVTTNLVRHATLGGIGTYIQVVNNTATSATCGATLGEYSFGIQFKNDTYRSLYHINVSATRGGSPWASGPSSWSFENEIFTMKEGTLTGNVVVSVTLTEDEYTVTTKTAPTTGLATITLYKSDGSAWGSTIPAGQTVYMDAVPGSGYVFDPYDNWKVGKASNESQDAAEVRGPASAGANDGRYYFTMPKEDVVVIATIANTAQDTYIDEMHDNVIDPATTRNNYTVPLLSDDSGGTVDCEQEHLYFVGWSKTSTGVGASSAPGDIIAGGISKTADGSTYYAVWATAVH